MMRMNVWKMAFRVERSDIESSQISHGGAQAQILGI